MSSPVINRVVMCEGTRFGTLISVYFESGRVTEYHGEVPQSAYKKISKWCSEHSLVDEHYHNNNIGQRYRRWE